MQLSIVGFATDLARHAAIFMTNYDYPNIRAVNFLMPQPLVMTEIGELTLCPVTYDELTQLTLCGAIRQMPLKWGVDLRIGFPELEAIIDRGVHG